MTELVVFLFFVVLGFLFFFLLDNAKKIGRIEAELEVLGRYKEALDIFFKGNKEVLEPSWRTHLDMMGYIAGVREDVEPSYRPLTRLG